MRGVEAMDNYLEAIGSSANNHAWCRLLPYGEGLCTVRLTPKTGIVKQLRAVFEILSISNIFMTPSALKSGLKVYSILLTMPPAVHQQCHTSVWIRNPLHKGFSSGGSRVQGIGLIGFLGFVGFI